MPRCQCVGGNLLVTNATINADGRGYAGGQGPGKGAHTVGASHGGAGNGSVLTNTYGAITAPTNLGSGGRYADKCGGGAIWLTVDGTTTVATAGMITANGLRENGCGAGGSIYLTTGWLTGTGTIRANGGDAINGGGGGGGRVAIILTGEGSTFSTWSGTNAAFGGASFVGAAGTVFRKTVDGETTLIIDNNNLAVVGLPMTAMLDTDMASFSNVVIRQKGVLGVANSTTLDFNTFLPTVAGATGSVITIHGDAGVTYPTDWTIQGYTLYTHGLSKPLVNVTIETNAVLDHYANSTAETYKLDLTVSGNLTVNGKILAEARGYGVGQGPGAGSPSSNGRGAAHGGTARYTDETLNSATYGSILEPVNLGSGAKSRGGGAIRLTVGGTTAMGATAAGGTVIVDNRNTATNATFTPLPAFTNSVEDLTMTAWVLQSRGKVGMTTNASVRSMTLNANSYLELDGHTLTTKLLTVTNLVYQPGTYTADELGGLVSDSSGSDGRVVVKGLFQGTVFNFR